MSKIPPEGTTEAVDGERFVRFRDHTGRQVMHEDAARFIRQVLLAEEEGRSADVKTLTKFIEEEFGEAFALVDVAAIQTASPQLLQRWRDVYGVPDGAERVAVLLNHANEPIWRIPDADSEERGASWMETPLHLVLEALPASMFANTVAETGDAPLHLRPRVDSSPLPPAVAKALTAWQPSEPE